jgi:hypothetical protein
LRCIDPVPVCSVGADGAADSWAIAVISRAQPSAKAIKSVHRRVTFNGMAQFHVTKVLLWNFMFKSQQDRGRV